VKLEILAVVLLWIQAIWDVLQCPWISVFHLSKDLESSLFKDQLVEEGQLLLLDWLTFEDEDRVV